MPTTGFKATEARAGQPSLFIEREVPVLVRAVFAGWKLVVSGEHSWAVWREPVADGLQARFPNKRTRAKILGEKSRLIRFSEASGKPLVTDATAELLDDFYWGARPDRYGVVRLPSESTAKNRQWAVKAVFEILESLGAPVDARSLLSNRIPRRAIKPPTRLLTDEEVKQVHTFANQRLISSTRPLLIAFSFTGATATELAAMRVSDVDLEKATVRFRGEAARTNPLDGWAKRTVARFFKYNPNLEPDALLCVSGRTNEIRAAHSVTVRLREALIDAGIAGRDGVSARSIRLTAARRVLDEAGIEAATRFLGGTCLTAAADALGHDWRNSDGG